MMVTFSAEDKGAPIHISSGKYVGMNGWLWLGKGHPPKQTYVVIIYECNKEKGVCVNNGNVGPPLAPPKDFVDALLQQHPVIDQALNKVCKMFAKCQLNGSEEALQKKILERMAAAYAQQLAEGEKATWFGVDYQDEEQDNYQDEEQDDYQDEEQDTRG
jgi:hypothetical protein